MAVEVDQGTLRAACKALSSARPFSTTRL
jgi:hypothetical protein